MKDGRQFVFTITNCQTVRSRSLTHPTNYKVIFLSAYWQWKLANERARICAVIAKFRVDAAPARPSLAPGGPFNTLLPRVLSAWLYKMAPVAQLWHFSVSVLYGTSTFCNLFSTWYFFFPCFCSRLFADVGGVLATKGNVYIFLVYVY